MTDTEYQQDLNEVITSFFEQYPISKIQEILIQNYKIEVIYIHNNKKYNAILKKIQTIENSNPLKVGCTFKINLHNDVCETFPFPIPELPYLDKFNHGCTYKHYEQNTVKIYNENYDIPFLKIVFKFGYPIKPIPEHYFVSFK